MSTCILPNCCKLYHARRVCLCLVTEQCWLLCSGWLVCTLLQKALSSQSSCCNVPSLLLSLWDTHIHVHTHMSNTKVATGTGHGSKPSLLPDWEPCERWSPMGANATLCTPQGDADLRCSLQTPGAGALLQVSDSPVSQRFPHCLCCCSCQEVPRQYSILRRLFHQTLCTL